MRFVRARARVLTAAVGLGLGLTPLVAGAVAGAARPSQGGSDRAATSTEVAELAQAAVDDDEALAELRAVTSIDGRPADLAAATSDLGAGSARTGRLEALAASLEGEAGSSASPVGPEEARRQALEVLDRDEYRERDVPRPFRGALRWLADRLRPLGRALTDLVGPILDLPGGRYLLLGLLVGAVTGLVAWIIRRRSRALVAVEGGGALGRDALDDPRDLERRSAAAEASGDYAEALRLAHLAGLGRLAEEGRLRLSSATTASDAARQVDHPRLDQLTETFEEVVYGGRIPTADDLAGARSGWGGLAGSSAGRRR